MECWFLPVDSDGGGVEIPLDQSLVGRDLDGGERYVEEGLLRDDLVRRDVQFDVGDEILLICALIDHRPGARERVAGSGAVVREDGFDVSVVCVVAAASLHDGAEPVAAGVLVGVDDDVVTLADADEEPLG